MHGVLHRVQQQVRACPQTGPLPCSCASSVLRDSMQCRAVEGRGDHMGSSPPAAAPHRDTASRPGQHLRGRRDVLLRCLSGCGSSSVRLADLCLCAGSPHQSSKAICVALACLLRTAKTRAVSWSPRQQEQELSFHLSAQTLPPQPREPCTYLLHWPLPHTRAAVPLAPGTEGGQRADPTLREEKGSNPTQSLCTAQGCSE